MKVLQIVIIKQAEDEYKVSTMGLNDKGRGEVLGTDYGTAGEMLATVAALIRLLEVAPK